MRDPAGASCARPATVLAEHGIEPLVAAREGGPGADQRHRRHARPAAARVHRPRPAAAHGRHHRGDERRGDARHVARCSPPTCRRCVRSPGRRSRRRTCARCSPTRRSSPRTPGRTASTSRTRTRCGARRRSPARPATRSRMRASVAAYELASAVDNPVVTLDGRVESNGNFHGAPVGVRARLPGHPGRRRRVDDRAAHRPDARRRPLARPAAVPRRRPGRRLGPHDRAVHPGGAGVRAQAARRAGLGRLDPVQRDAGGPRLDGLVGRAQAAPLGRRAEPGAGDRAAHRGAGARPARAAAAGPGDRRGGAGAARDGRRARARTATCRRRSRRPSQFVQSGAAVAAADRPSPAAG